MRRISRTWFTGLFLIAMFAAQALCQSSTAPNQNPAASSQSATTPPANQEQSLGSYARTVRKKKAQPGAKTFDNDTIPKSDTISVVGDTSTSGRQAAASDDEVQPQPGSNSPNQMPKVTPGQSQQERQQVYDQWQGKISEQQSKIDGIAHELDLDQREYRLRAASFYGDAGARLRDEGQWDKQDAQYKEKIADKQKDLDNAKQALNDLHEQARKAGVPASAQESAAADSNQE